MNSMMATSAKTIKSVLDMPYKIRVDADLRIPVQDGRHLSARLWLPEGEGALPVPAVIEYVPYRHRDFTYPRDTLIHPWFAGHGFASIRLDPAGSQESDGPPMDEYIRQEQDDCIEALSWIAQQPWCSGRTGMFGMSWGAFSALQVAARRPPSLKAIIPVHGTDDRYRDDIHYKGGCLLTAGLAWGATYQLYMMRPPDPEVMGSEWREIWLSRMKSAPNVLEKWISHASRDEYWKHGSICEDYSAIEAAALIVGGWSDGYKNAIFRMIDGLSCPHSVLIGPWGHGYPHLASPGPCVDFLQEATSWWEKWLKNISNGVDGKPLLRVYFQDYAPPRPQYEKRDGYWVSIHDWPLKNVEEKVYFLNREILTSMSQGTDIMTVCTPLSNHIAGGEWLPLGTGPESPLDQQFEDAGSICFDTPVLDTPIEIAGVPAVALTIASDTHTGVIYIRLSDVAPTGESTLITYGLLNLEYRNGFEKPVKMRPGRWVNIIVSLDFIFQCVPKGHRLRVSISTQAWPLVWPAVETMTMKVQLGQSKLTLPQWQTGANVDDTPSFEAGAIPENTGVTWLRDGRRERYVKHDIISGEFSRTYVKDEGAFRIEEHGMEIDSCGSQKFTAIGDDPLTARADLFNQISMSRGDWSIQLISELTITADKEAFRIVGKRQAIEGNTIVHDETVNQRMLRYGH